MARPRPARRPVRLRAFPVLALTALALVAAACGSPGAGTADADAPSDTPGDPGPGPREDLSFHDGAVVLRVAPGAVPGGTVLSVDPATGLPGDPREVPGTAWRFGPEGLRFAGPVELLLRYDPQAIPGDGGPGGLQVHRLEDGAWVPVAGGGVLEGSRQAWAPLSGFSVYGLLAAGEAGPPRLVAVDPAAARPGDPVRLDATGLSGGAALYAVEFTGATAAPHGWEALPDGRTVRLTADVPDRAVSGPVALRRLADGFVTNALEFQILSGPGPTLSGLAPQTPLLHPCTRPHPGTPGVRTCHGYTLLLRGSGFLGLRHPTQNPGSARPSGNARVLVRTSLGEARLEGVALADDLLAATLTTRDGSHSAGEPVPVDALAVLADLEPGDPVSLRICGDPVAGGVEACTPERVLPLQERLVEGATWTVASDLAWAGRTGGVLEIPVGDVACIGVADPSTYGPTSPDTPDVLSAEGLWEGEIPFAPSLVSAFAPVAGKACLRVESPGEHRLVNRTRGRQATLRFVREGVPASRTFDVAPEAGLQAGFGGARIRIPPGALPPREGGGGTAWRVEASLGPSAGEPFDPVQAGSRLQATLRFDPEPPGLAGAVALDLPFDPAAGGDPVPALWDGDSSLWWDLPGTADAASGRVALELPAGDYGPGAPEAFATAAPGDGGVSRPAPAAPGPPLGLPPVGLNRAFASVGTLRRDGARSTAEDAGGHFRVDYVNQPGHGSHVPDSYAAGILETLLAARQVLVSAGWPAPGGRQEVRLRDYGEPGAYQGSTERRLFGLARPVVYLNARMEEGSPRWRSVPAHEMGHVFQRQRIYTAVARWIDEAIAEWVAHAVAGPAFWTYSMDNAVPWIRALPGGFYLGMDEEAAYASGSLATWMALTFGPAVLDDLYSHLEAVPGDWSDSVATLEWASGKAIGELYESFALAFWSQSFDPASRLSLDALLPTLDAEAVLHVLDGWAGVEAPAGAVRPPLSSTRHRVDVADSFWAQALGRPVVARGTGLDGSAVVHVLADGACDGRPPVLLTPLVRLHGGRPSAVLGAVGDSPCYRLVAINTATAGDRQPAVRLAVPDLSGLSPDRGSNAGGYPVTVSGAGLGTSPGTARLGGFPLDVLSWADTAVTVRMLDAGTFTGPMDLVLQTAERADTDALPFTFTPRPGR